MSEKIRRHQEERPKQWQTLEEPLELARVLIDRKGQNSICCWWIA